MKGNLPQNSSTRYFYGFHVLDSIAKYCKRRCHLRHFMLKLFEQTVLIVPTSHELLLEAPVPSCAGVRH